ncbi:MAG: hypothetical protein ABSC56_03345 [Solirubrobacteraceae bacterium]|jgi:hypothetical protein
MTWRAGAALLALLGALSLAGCESTEQESAQIAKRLGHQSADAAVTQIKGTNAAVRVDQAQIVSSRSGTAAALELTNTSSRPQADIPILVTAYDAAGKAVYSNATVGESSPSGELSFLAAHATAWWVDGSLLAAGGTPVRLTAKIGDPTTSAVQLALSVSHLAAGSNFVGPLIDGKAVNGSASAESDATVYAVALVGGHLVGAGQGVVPALAAHGSASFQVNVTGKAAGATVAATIVPAHIS